jgi:AraC-like DNA-binding protein
MNSPEERLSDSPYVESIWYGVAEQDGSFTAPADARWELIVRRQEGQANFIVSGQVTKATPDTFTAGTKILSIKFKVGTFLPWLSPGKLPDTRIALPNATSKSFWFQGSAWQYPTFENADTFVNRLIRDGLLMKDPLVEAVLQDKPQDWSVHTVRRRFLKATGFTQGTIRQIERARCAAELLTQGVSILDTVYELGYSDQPHLTRSLKHYIGQTPGQIVSAVASVANAE